MDVKTFVLFTLIFSLIMVQATIQATGVSDDDGEGPRSLTLHRPHIGVFVVSAGKYGELMGSEDPVEEEYVSSTNNNAPVVPDSGDLMIPVVDESPLAVQLGRRLLGAAVESNSSAAPGY
nr:uncharacterized protein LOC109193912 isoform X1 [Ipomoea trifida]